MFYWTVGQHYLVLTDEEEDALLLKVSLGPEDRIGYTCDRDTRKVLELRMGAELKRLAREDPKRFELTYLERRGVGPGAVPMLRSLVESYAHLTKRAVWGLVKPLSTEDLIGSAVWLRSASDALFITAIKPPLFRPKLNRLVPLFVLGFRTASVARVAGRSDGFVLITDAFSVRFGKDGIRLFSLSTEDAV